MFTNCSSMADRKVKRIPSKKSHSLWWDSHISKNNSKWLSENLEEMDRLVKEMLKLIEEDGDSFANKAEMHCRKRPELISHVVDFYRMYRTLGERYDKVIGDIRRNIPSNLKSQGSGNGSDIDFESSSLSNLSEDTPESKQQHTNLKLRAAGFDASLGSGVGSNISRKGRGHSSSSSDSESDYSDEKNSNDISSTLHQRVLELEDELREVKEKLRMQEQKCFYEHSKHIEARNHLECNSKISKLEDLSFANEKFNNSKAEIMDLQRKLIESNASLENVIVECDRKKNMAAVLEERVAALEGDILSYQNEIEHLKGAATSATKQFQTELSVCVSQTRDFESELIDSKEKFSQEKSTLEAAIEIQKSINMELRTELDELLTENLLLEARISELDHVVQVLKLSSASDSDELLKEKSALETEVIDLSESFSLLDAKIKSLDGHIRQLEVERMEAGNESEKCISVLNQSIDALKDKLNMLTSDRDDLIAKVDILLNDLKCSDDRIYQMDLHSQQLHLEHVKLTSEIEEHKRTSSELKVRVKELEDEVEEQKVVISDGAEGKKEAIRQLCLSIEHYRDGYYQLIHLLQGHKRPMVMAN